NDDNEILQNGESSTIEDKYIKEGLIRIPFPAYETFKDDPLRVLRCIRFASRIQFEIVDDGKDAIIKNDSIKTALNEKISRERNWIRVFSSPSQETILSGKFEDSKICLNTAKILKWLLSDESKNYEFHPKFRQLNEDEKVALGLLIREFGSKRLTNLLFALSNELISKFDIMYQVKEISDKYTKLIERVQELKLENVFNEKPILNGKDIQNLLKIKQGPEVRNIEFSHRIAIRILKQKQRLLHIPSYSPIKCQQTAFQIAFKQAG
ncbi:2720_t:CDS:2, partial [Funneliformis caledonium]